MRVGRMANRALITLAALSTATARSIPQPSRLLSDVTMEAFVSPLAGIGGVLSLGRSSTLIGFVHKPQLALGQRRRPAVLGVSMMSTAEKPEAMREMRKNFIANVIEKDLETGKHKFIRTRFPPEPNGYLHIGHAKSICLNYGIAKEYGGVTNMRFDDTNPVKEDQEYVTSIIEDVRWLVSGSVDGKDPWDGSVRHASDYFDLLYDCAVYLIKQGKAYVEDLTAEEMREYRGTLTQPGKPSPYRTRSVEENLDLFERMRIGEFKDGEKCLRAIIDMSSPNINLRDPALYRIRRATHVMTGDKWLIYPMYDYAHCISDAVEEITHSLCTLEFEDHRPLYDWVLDQLQDSGLIKCHPQQIEFSRLNLQYTVLSKRKLIQLVDEKHVSGWSDPRMPTISGIRRRGYTPEALRLFCDRVGISKAENNIDISVLEDCAREVLEDEAPRAFAVVNPIKMTITNWPEGKVEMFEAPAHPKRLELGTREIPFSGSVMIDAEDFNEDPPKGYQRLVPGGQVRLRFAYVVTCDEVVKDKDGKVTELKVTYNPDTRAGATPEGAPRVKGIVQWVSTEHAVPVEFRIYDRLFSTPAPGSDQPEGNFLLDINPDSVAISKGFVEPSVKDAKAGDRYQFERVGYFSADIIDSKPGKPVFNRIVTLRDTWANKGEPPARVAKQQKQQQDAAAQSPNAKSGADLEPLLRLDIRVGKIVSAEKHPDAEALYIEQIDVGDPEGPRTIVSGLANFIPLEQMQGRMCTVVCNLKPAKMRGVESSGMVLCATNEDVVELLEPPEGAEVGERVTFDGYDAPNPDPVLKNKGQQKVWPNVQVDLKVDDQGRAAYKGALMQTSAGPLVPKTLKSCPIS